MCMLCILASGLDYNIVASFHLGELMHFKMLHILWLNYKQLYKIYREI